MESLEMLLSGFRLALTIQNLLAAFFGCLVGTMIGVLPGLGPAATVALLLPLTFGRDPVTSLVMLAAIYYGAQYGGSTTSILLNIPGESASVVTCLDGYQLARQGRAAPALGMAAIGSFVAGVLGVIGLTLGTVPLAEFGLRFGPAEQFALLTFALAACGTLAGDLLKGLIMVCFGLFLSTIGGDPMSGVDRFTLGRLELMGGLELVPLLMGLFAVGEVLVSYEQILGIKPLRVRWKRFTELLPNVSDWVVSKWAVLRGSLLGFAVGVLPGTGAATASFVAYGIERRFSRTPEKFGKGAMEGVAAAESANNAAAQGAMVPMLALGIPGSPTMAMLMAGLMMAGVQPGPLLMEQRPDIVWGVIASMFIGNCILLVLNLPLVGVWASLLRIPYTILGPCILVIAVLGTYSIAGSMFDVWTLIVFGLLGYVLKKNDFPLAPIVIGFILGNKLELSLRRALTMSHGDPRILVGSPIAAVLVGLSLAMLLWQPLTGLIRRARASRLQAS